MITESEIRIVQTQLAAMLLYPTSLIDGRWGPQTRSALYTALGIQEAQPSVASRLLTWRDATELFGDPKTERFMVLYEPPDEVRKANDAVPRRIYCNRNMPRYLDKAFENLDSRGFLRELKTWDGCFNIRPMKGSGNPSLHAWGLAVDLNAATNGYNRVPTLTEGFVKCWLDAGFDWGGTWRTPDGMHFQLKRSLLIK